MHIFFNKVRNKPQLNQWELSDREEFSKWVINTLAMQHVLDRSNASEVQDYLRELRSLFFPMIRSPHLTQKCVLPSLSEFKALLYNNDIGYKTEEGKLYVRRFYRLPMLMFPQETFQTHVCADLEKLKLMVSDDDNLVKEMNAHGITCSATSKLFGQVKSELHEYARKHPLLQFGKSPRRSQSDDDSSSDFSSSSSDSSLEAVEESVEELLAGVSEFTSDGRLVRPRSDKNMPAPEEWEKLVRKYAKRPTNALEKDREEYYHRRLSGKSIHFLDCRSESDLMILQRQRLDKDMLTRARLALLYEDKESARRGNEWKKRGVWMNNSTVTDFKLPVATLNVK